MVSPSEDGGKIKPEAIHGHILVPVNQAVLHQRLHPWMINIHGIAATGIVDIAVRITRFRAVIGQVIDTFKAQRRTLLITFACMVINHVQDHFYTGIMDHIHHFPEFCNRVPISIS